MVISLYNNKDLSEHLEIYHDKGRRGLWSDSELARVKTFDILEW